MHRAAKDSSHKLRMTEDHPTSKPALSGVLAYAAPVLGSYFFYIPMWSILPGIYVKYFGLSLTSVAAVVLMIRLFDGISDLTVGYLSDRHRAAGGSRKPWVIVGGLGMVISCQFLFKPPDPATTTYYLLCSLAYFLAFAVAEIPHLTWGSELTLDYHERARVYAARHIFSKLGIAVFYALPLLPGLGEGDYTPEVLHLAVVLGAVISLMALSAAMFVAPAGMAVKPAREDHLRLLFRSLIQNKPLLLYFAAVSCGAVCYGMWYGVLYLYLDSYLQMGEKIAVMFLIATIGSGLTTPFWLKLVQRTGKAAAWGTGISLFLIQLLCTLCIDPGDPWWLALSVVLIAHLCFTSNDVAAVSTMGDIVDYGKLKFGVDRGATYFAFLNLIFKVGLGIGGGLSLGIAGLFGFSAQIGNQSAESIWGLKLAFIALPACLAIACLVLVMRMPINERRHRIIQRRIESRIVRGGAT